MKVFLSHSTKDKEFVEKLAAAMTASGFEPWRCEVEIETGANFVAEISKGLKGSDLLLLVWSPDAAQSAWTETEWTSALKQQVEESRTRVGLIMLRQHDLPPLLATTNYIDATRDHDTGIHAMIEWLKRRESAHRLSGEKAPVYLPDYRPEDFVGRATYLAQLQDEFFPEPGKYLLYGEPGAGKSTLALQFAWDAQKDFDAVIFQYCGQRPLDAITAELVKRLPIKVNTLPPDQQRDAAKEWLRQRQSLLVLDDVWLNSKGEFYAKELEPGPACSVLYTSRMRSLPGVASRQSSAIGKFSEAECEELFHAMLDPTFGAEEVTGHRDALLNFAGTVEMLPVAVAVGAGMLRGMEATPLDVSALALHIKDLKYGVKDVPDLFRKAIDAQGKPDQTLLAACAVCVQEGFSLELGASIAGLALPDARKSANHLVRSSLLRVLDRDRQRFQMHALLREVAVVAAPQSGNELAELHERHAAALERLFQDWEKRWLVCRDCLEEITPAAAFLGARGESGRAWQLSHAGYETGCRIGELGVALRIMQQQESFWAGRKDPVAKTNLAASYGNQARILRRWGRLKEALALYDKADAIFLELRDKKNLQFSCGNRAVILQAMGRLNEALTLLMQQEAICRELDNRDGLQLSYGNQAMIIRRLGRPEEALALLKKAESICLEMGNHEGLADNYGNQASILAGRRRLEEALALLKKQEEICLELGSREGLGHCYWIWGLVAGDLGDRQAGEQKLEQALAIFTALKMPIERDAVQVELDKTNSSQS